MPRNPNAGSSTLRNRNRVTNKTRLKIIQGNIDADPLILDEDEEKARVVSTAGVDAEDANEHHLQAVLSAAAHRHQSNARSTRTSTEKDKVPAAYIPTPDSTGLVDNYDQLYPHGLWKDPATYLRWSSTVEESVNNALNGGFAYYMDEHDKEWLDKNNEEARGEGTSAQGAISTSPSTRSSQAQRSSKAKGKEPEVVSPVVISEDEFELVMAVFEKVTHDKTEYLHHALEQGMPFPAFSEYHDIFSTSLSPSMFSNFITPAWLPNNTHLLRIARVVYPHWRERRLECNGHRIIPTVNLDEADTKNESYICFRRREIKAVRKTRASTVIYSDKLSRLKAELTAALDIASEVVTREIMKKEVLQQTQQVWDNRFTFSELKRKFPSLSLKEDEELLIDKERPPKRVKPDSRMLRIKTNDNVLPLEPMIRPKECAANIAAQIERELAHVKERDHGCWDDLVENPYQLRPVPLAQRYFKLIPRAHTASSEKERYNGTAVAMRRRVGRGGRMHYDRRVLQPRSSRPSYNKPTDDYFNRKVDFVDHYSDRTVEEIEDLAQRVSERWRFDQDDTPPVIPEGPDELDRTLIDDYEPLYMRHSMTLLHDPDHLALMTDPTLPVTTADGKQHTVLPFRLGPQQMVRRDVPQTPLQRQTLPTATSTQPQVSPSINPSMPASTPISQSQLKKMQPPAIPPMRMPSNGSMRAPATPNLPTIPNSHTSPSPSSQPTPVNGHITDGGRSLENHTQQNLVDMSQESQQVHPGHSDGPTGSPPESVASVRSVSPTRPASQNQQPGSITIPTMPNGYHISAINGYPVTTGTNPSVMPYPNSSSSGLSAQQVQAIKSAFANAGMSTVHDVSTNGVNMVPRVPASYISHVVPNGVNYEMQLRQIQWNNTQQRMGPNGLNGSMSPAPGSGYSPPLPSVSPVINGMRGGGIPVSHVISQGQHAHLQSHSPSPLLQSPSPVQNPSLHPSPPRPPSQPPMASPSLQAQQPVGASGGRYS